MLPSLVCAHPPTTRPSTQRLGPPLPTPSKTSSEVLGRYQSRCFQPMIVGSSPGSTATHDSTGARGGSSAASQPVTSSRSTSTAPQSASACLVLFSVQPIHHCRSIVVAGPNLCNQRAASSAAASRGSRSPSPPGSQDSAST